MRLAQLANFMGPTTGGLRGVVEEIGGAHVRAGGERLLITPAPATKRTVADGTTRLTIASPRLPGRGHAYHVLLRRQAVRDALEEFGPDLVEVHDQTTLTWVTAWARQTGVPTVLFSHERFDLVVSELARLRPQSLDRVGSWWSSRLAASFDVVVCASDFAAAPFTAEGAANVRRIPFGVDLEQFVPAATSGGADEGAGGLASPVGPWHPDTRRLVFAGRLWPEKAPDVAVEVVAELCAQGLPVELALVGTGPLEPALRRWVERERLPVHFVGHLTDRRALARMVAAAEVALSPGPRETFGLSVLEAMACGTPVIVSNSGASRELLGRGTGHAGANAAEMAQAVTGLLTDPGTLAQSRVAARRRAEEFSWARTDATLARLRCALTSPQPAADAVP